MKSERPNSRACSGSTQFPPHKIMKKMSSIHYGLGHIFSGKIMSDHFLARKTIKRDYCSSELLCFWEGVKSKNHEKPSWSPASLGQCIIPHTSGGSDPICLWTASPSRLFMRVGSLLPKLKEYKGIICGKNSGDNNDVIDAIKGFLDG